MVEIGKYYSHDTRHYRFERTTQSPIAIEVYEVPDKLRWVAFVVAITATVLSAFV